MKFEHEPTYQGLLAVANAIKEMEANPLPTKRQFLLDAVTRIVVAEIGEREHDDQNNRTAEREMLERAVRIADGIWEACR